MGFSENELEILSGLNLLTAKPFIYAANVSEVDLASIMEGEENEYVTSLRNTVSSLGGSVCVVSAQLESELIQLDADERRLFMEELGVKSSGLSRYTAPQAAGVIHTDFERGFIKAETVSCDDFILYNGFQKVKEKGLYRLEGKDYTVEDGDIMIFKFNV
ncbi:unnamed protein product [Bathycoccus prasinos]